MTDILDDTELDSILPDNDEPLTFPKATINPGLVELQIKVVDFVTSVIVRHEKEFNTMLDNNFGPVIKQQILTTTNKNIIQMITETTNKFYNNIYHNIQHKLDNILTILILDMCKLCDYGVHILLDKLIRITVELHIDITRENISTKTPDLHSKTLLIEIDLCFKQFNLMNILSKEPGENNEFVNIPDGISAFNIVIEKNIDSVN